MAFKLEKRAAVREHNAGAAEIGQIAVIVPDPRAERQGQEEPAFADRTVQRRAENAVAGERGVKKTVKSAETAGTGSRERELPHANKKTDGSSEAK